MFSLTELFPQLTVFKSVIYDYVPVNGLYISTVFTSLPSTPDSSIAYTLLYYKYLIHWNIITWYNFLDYFRIIGGGNNGENLKDFTNRYIDEKRFEYKPNYDKSFYNKGESYYTVC